MVLYYIYFEIVGNSCNLIGSQQNDLFANRISTSISISTSENRCDINISISTNVKITNPDLFISCAVFTSNAST